MIASGGLVTVVTADFLFEDKWRSCHCYDSWLSVWSQVEVLSLLWQLTFCWKTSRKTWSKMNWEGRNKNGKLPGSRRSIQRYILTYSRLRQENLWQLLVFSSGDQSFCVRSTPLRVTAIRMYKSFLYFSVTILSSRFLSVDWQSVAVDPKVFGIIRSFNRCPNQYACFPLFRRRLICVCLLKRLNGVWPTSKCMV